MAWIEEIEDIEIDLDDALTKLQAAAPPIPVVEKKEATGFTGRPAGAQLPPEYDQIEAAVEVIPNNFHYDEWVVFGMEICSATNGTGFDLFDQLSRRSPKYNEKTTRDRWNSFRPNGGRTVASLFWRADQADPDWRRRYREAKTNVMTEEYRQSIIETYEMIKQLHNKGADHDKTNSHISI